MFKNLKQNKKMKSLKILILPLLGAILLITSCKDETGNIDDNSLKEKFGIQNGRKQNEAIQWYADGHYKHLANYQNGKSHGDKKTWSADSSHILLAHLKYKEGKPHGAQTKWYPTGELFKKLNLNMGKEEGLHQAFRKNSALYANYEAKEGRTFGLRKATLCYSLEDENIQYEK